MGNEKVNGVDDLSDNLGLTTWQDAPNGKIQKFDVSVAKKRVVLKIN
jgi:hypothetical protein